MYTEYNYKYMSTIKIYLYIELFFLRLFKCVWDLSSSTISISMIKYVRCSLNKHLGDRYGV